MTRHLCHKDKMEKKGFSKIAIIRGSTSYQSVKNYNSQEIGLAKALLTNGIHTDIFYASKNKKSSLVKIEKGIIVIYLPVLKIAGQQGIMLGMNNYIKSNNYELIQVSEHNSLISFVAAVIAKKSKIPVVLLQGMYEAHKGFFSSKLEKLFNILFANKYRKSVSATICKTHGAFEFLKSKKVKNATVIPVCLSPDNFGPLTNKRDFKPSKHVVLYVGKLEQRRNPIFMLELAKSYLQNQDVTFIFIGNGPLAEAVRLSKPKNVQIIPEVPQKDIQKYYGIADVLLMPTNYEIFGMVYLEAIYFGVPIITTENAGSIDVLKNKKYAFLEKNLVTSNWKEKTDTFLFDENVIKKAKKELAKDKLGVTWECVVDRYIKVYHNVLNYRN